MSAPFSFLFFASRDVRIWMFPQVESKGSNHLEICFEYSVSKLDRQESCSPVAKVKPR